MKKNVLFAFVLVALLALPAVVMAQTEFTLGGYLKLETFWDSSQQGKNMNTPIQRENNRGFHHGRFFATAQSSRFNFTIKGPKLWGATVTGFLEMDFDGTNEFTAGNSASNNYTPRLRHAFFRLNWPETELLFGQTWGYFSEFYPESVQDGPFQFHGCATQRLPQIRVTQTFGVANGKVTLSGLIGKPQDPGTSDANLQSATSVTPALPGTAARALGQPGSSSETPQIQAKVAYEADLWGKAAFYGRPRGFVAQVAAGWQRTRYENNNQALFAASTFGQNGYNNFGAVQYQRSQQYKNNWMFQFNTFIPVIPTYSQNLAGTASLSLQFYIGDGLAAFGEGTDTDNSYFMFNSFDGLFWAYDRKVRKQYGGYLQAQYYFTNQWFLNAVYGFSKAYGISRDNDIFVLNFPDNFKYLTVNDQTKMWQEFDLTLYYRPITAVKFGLQYSYCRTDWLQRTTVQGRTTDMGDAHRVSMGAWFFF